MEPQLRVDETWGDDWHWDDNSTVGGSPQLAVYISSLDDEGDSLTHSGGVKAWEQLLRRHPSGSVQVFQAPSVIPDLQVDEIAEDRLALLSKKYAATKHGLNREDDARLKILNAEIDIQTPRYTEEDRKLLDEARALLAELEG